MEKDKSPNHQLQELEIVITQDPKEEGKTMKVKVREEDKWPFLLRVHVGHFRISLSLCSQALLLKQMKHYYPSSHFLSLLPSFAFTLHWALASVSLLSLSLLYLCRCARHWAAVQAEFSSRLRVNYLFAPSISSMLLLQSFPFSSRELRSPFHRVWFWASIAPVIALDLRIYGQWFTRGKRFNLAAVANPSAHLSVIANFVGAKTAVELGREEVALLLFSVGTAHYLVLFVTLYQRIDGCGIPRTLYPVFFLYVAAPSAASLGWGAISGAFDIASKMFFFLALFLFTSLAVRPNFFRKAMGSFHVSWWAYPFSLTMLALASIEYAEGSTAHVLKLLLCITSILVTTAMVALTAFNMNSLLPNDIILFPNNLTPPLSPSDIIFQREKERKRSTAADTHAVSLDSGCIRRRKGDKLHVVSESGGVVPESKAARVETEEDESSKATAPDKGSDVNVASMHAEFSALTEAGAMAGGEEPEVDDAPEHQEIATPVAPSHDDEGTELFVAKCKKYAYANDSAFEQLSVVFGPHRIKKEKGSCRGRSPTKLTTEEGA
ncbi:S-type anion channel SLAH4 [Amborella trichopoda]|uniref:S-type anion channel SLAH4 n=1 Tax=Amborella trichopoda TaxID=13333 RepID=UPI0009BD68A7|nr:S-type anion channel SLAH4 [Amborella trichopoda]|eukprot:XP_020524627.1 S-type anion channel SLAH4 [Amborella trichopoda]